jgi:hypothetical protein
VTPYAVCSVPGCSIRKSARGMCNKHYLRMYCYGRTELKRATADEEPLIANTRTGDVPLFRPDLGPCLIWIGPMHSSGKTGYGWFRGRQLAHRVAYQLKHGSIPNKLQIDHLCRVRACVRVEHLELVTHKENVLRGESPSTIAKRTGRCVKWGHPLSGPNLYIVQATGDQRCLACVAIREGRPYAHLI